MASPTAKRSLTLSDGSRIVDALVPSLRTELTNRSLSSEGLRTALESRLLEVRAQELLLLLATGETIASLSELLAVVKGTLLLLPRLARLYSAYRRFTVLNRDFSDRTIAEILGDGQMLRSFMVFLKSLYATFGFDVAQLDAVVTACDDFALRVDDQQRLVAFVFNAQQAFCQSFLDYTSALHAWYSVVSLDSPPKLVAALQHLVDANEALNKISGMDLSAFGLHSAAGAVAASSVFCPPVVATELALKRPRSPEPTSSDPSGAHKRDSDFC